MVKDLPEIELNVDYKASTVIILSTTANIVVDYSFIHWFG